MKILLNILTALMLAAPALCLAQEAPVPVSKGSVTMEVPDSLADDIRKVIEGRYAIDKSRHGSIDEKTIVGRDTVSMVMHEPNIGRFSRGLYNYLFIPKDNWMFGVTASYGEFSSDDLQVLDLLSDFDFRGHIFSINPYLSYFIRNNLSVGVRVGYTSGKATIGSLVMDFDDDLNLDIHDVSYRTESLSTALFLRQYIGLSRRGRFGVFNELELAFSSGNSDFTRPYNGVLKNTHTTTQQLGLNFSPGLTVFINEYASFNISFAVVGFYLRNEKQRVDGEDLGSRFASGANFRFNLFNINFGLGIHI